MQNKYLEKIAGEMKPGDDKRASMVVGGVGIAGTSLGLANAIKQDYHAGNITGRETFYHGTSRENLDKIRKEGLLPNTSGRNVSGLVSDQLASANKDLVFATKKKDKALKYGVTQQAIQDRGLSSTRDLIDWRTNNAKEEIQKAVKSKDTSNIAEIRIPTWKDGFKTVSNPEYGMIVEREKVLFPYQPHLRELRRQEHYRNYVEGVHVQKGPKGIGAEYIKGSNYKRTPIKEVVDFAKHDPKRFLKGISKPAAGLGLIGVGGYLTAKGIGGE